MKSSTYNDNCGCRIATCSVKEEKQAGLWRYMAFLSPGLIIWAVLYHFLAPAAKWLTYSLFGLAPESHIASAVEFFFRYSKGIDASYSYCLRGGNHPLFLHT